MVVRPENIALLGTLGLLGRRSFNKISKTVNAQQDLVIETLNEKIEELELKTSKELRDTQVEILRLQILQGIDSKRLSYSEILYFFDKYKALGGNSFVEDKVQKYIYDIQNKEEDK